MPGSESGVSAAQLQLCARSKICERLDRTPITGETLPSTILQAQSPARTLCDILQWIALCFSLDSASNINVAASITFAQGMVSLYIYRMTSEAQKRSTTRLLRQIYSGIRRLPWTIGKKSISQCQNTMWSQICRNSRLCRYNFTGRRSYKLQRKSVKLSRIRTGRGLGKDSTSC